MGTYAQSIENASQTIGITKEQFAEQLRQSTLLKRLPVTDDTAKMASFLASNHADTITGAIINASCGRFLD